ncbi:hypothetical protein M513_12926 [Trichuris suis]|uniref:Uncharacterized protein n=1 Tax=Trichuris suis TaxID=68888 RepID=A0A085LMJ9_9BILA|nr:hypothetical protein M513_12926 [Trichuris suis]
MPLCPYRSQTLNRSQYFCLDSRKDRTTLPACLLVSAEENGRHFYLNEHAFRRLRWTTLGSDQNLRHSSSKIWIKWIGCAQMNDVICAPLTEPSVVDYAVLSLAHCCCHMTVSSAVCSNHQCGKLLTRQITRPILLRNNLCSELFLKIVRAALASKLKCEFRQARLVACQGTVEFRAFDKECCCYSSYSAV